MRRLVPLLVTLTCTTFSYGLGSTVPASASATAPVAATAPGAATAPVAVTAAELHAALAAAATASAAADVRGWGTDVSTVPASAAAREDLGLDSARTVVRADLVGKRVSYESVTRTGTRAQLLGTLTAEGHGIYIRFDMNEAVNRAALVYLRKPAARFAFTADKTRKIADDAALRFSPQTIAREAADADDADLSSASWTVTPSGGKEYTATSIDGDATYTKRYVLEASGRLVRHVLDVPGKFTTTMTFSYVRPAVNLPAPATYVTVPELTRARAAAELGATVRGAAMHVARNADAAAARAHRTTRLADVTRAARRVIPAHYSKTAGYAIPVTYRATSRRVMVYATNPYTKKVVTAYVRVVAGQAVVT